MLMSEYIAEVKRWFFRTEGGKIVRCKRKSKQLAADLSLPIPKSYSLPGPYVLKPINGSSCLGVQIVDNPDDFELEERLIGSDGSNPPKDYKVFSFGEEVKIVRVCQRSMKMTDVSFAWYRYPEWEPIEILRPNTRYGVLTDELPPKDLAKMVQGTLAFQERFDVLIRADWYQTERGAIFGELCATTGSLQKTDIVIPEADQLFGSWIPESYLSISRDMRPSSKK